VESISTHASARKEKLQIPCRDSLSPSDSLPAPLPIPWDSLSRLNSTPLCSSTHLIIQADNFDIFLISVIGRAKKEGLLSLAGQLKKYLILIG
jgi:hypothetical protein